MMTKNLSRLKNVVAFGALLSMGLLLQACGSDNSTLPPVATTGNYSPYSVQYPNTYYGSAYTQQYFVPQLQSTLGNIYVSQSGYIPVGGQSIYVPAGNYDWNTFYSSYLYPVAQGVCGCSGNGYNQSNFWASINYNSFAGSVSGYSNSWSNLGIQFNTGNGYQSTNFYAMFNMFASNNNIYYSQYAPSYSGGSYYIVPANTVYSNNSYNVYGYFGWNSY